jgi:ubiquinone biosynthesis protein UbiJ
MQDPSEYLQEETRLVTTGFELEDFARQVDTLRNDTDRLQARLQRLKNHLQQEQQNNGEPSV